MRKLKKYLLRRFTDYYDLAGKIETLKAEKAILIESPNSERAKCIKGLYNYHKEVDRFKFQLTV